MAFDSIQKYKHIASQEGVNTSTAAAKSAEVESKIEKSFINSAFAEGAEKNNAGNGGSGDVQLKMTMSDEPGVNIDTSAYQNALNSYMNSALRQAKAQMTLNTIGSVAGTLGTLLSGSAGNSSLGGLSGFENIFKSSKSGKTDAATPEQTAKKSADSAIKDLKLSNDLQDALADYNKKPNEKRKAEVQKQLSTAEADRNTLAGKLSEQTSIITKATEEKKVLEEEAAKLNTEATKLQSEVDTLTDSIKNAANAEIGKLDKDDETQKGIIDKSQKDVTTKKEECTAAVGKQNDIISANKSTAEAKITSTTDPTTGKVTYSPCTPQEKQQAIAAINAAKQEIVRLEKERDEFIKAEEEKQKAAQEKIAENAVKRSEQQAIVDKPDTDPAKGADLQAKKSELEQKRSAASEKTAEANAKKQTIADATVLQQTCQQRMNQLSSQIVQARGIVGS